jgi:undecaprenyl-diphosphatase
MTLLDAIILGIIQGATEFLPVSSSGHSVLLPALLGMAQPDLAASVIAHLGTLLAVVIYFARDLWGIMVAALASLRDRQLMATAESRLAWYIVVGCIPAALLGLALESWFEALFHNPRWAALFLLATAVILITGERLLSGHKKLADMTWLDAIVIGLFQAVALLPGVSRSGSTIMAGLMRGLNRELAARYSFLLSVPIIFGAGLVEIAKLFSADIAIPIAPLVATFVTSALVGYGCIYFLMAWLRQRSLYPFAIYCALFGIGFLLFG